LQKKKTFVSESTIFGGSGRVTKFLTHQKGELGWADHFLAQPKKWTNPVWVGLSWSLFSSTCDEPTPMSRVDSLWHPIVNQ